jgi:uncharacterized protein (DUF305 family)
MSTDADLRDEALDDEEPPRTRRPIVVALVTVAAIAAIVAAVAVGYVWGNGGGNGVTAPSATSVDVGFARDMSTHHLQAITMASYTRDNTDDSAIKVLAYDIESSQNFQVGEMQGWLDVWNMPRLNPSPMAWMAGHDHLQADGLMPGMASQAEMNKLQTLHGKALDIMFLQLMIRHHQGGIPMAQYAEQHATNGYVRDLAQSMINAQSGEIISMEQMLRSLGASPLPAPPTH